MGLDCSHGAFSGSYNSFSRFRQAVAACLGGSYPPHKDKDLDEAIFYMPDEITPSAEMSLRLFLAHSDCDREFSPSECQMVAILLESVGGLLDEYERANPSAGHILRDGGYRRVAERFAKGCRLAYESGEPLEFY